MRKLALAVPSLWILIVLLAGAGQGPRLETGRDLGEIVDTFRERYEAGASDAMEIEVSEDEANAYLKHRAAESLPSGIKTPWVRFSGDNAARAGALLDLALLRDRLPASLADLLSGEVEVELATRVEAGAGVGKIVIESLTLGGLPLPETLIQQLLAGTESSPLPEGVRVGEPFPLPYGIESVRIHSGRLVVRQGPRSGS